MSLISFNFHGTSWESQTGIHAGLYKSPRDNTASNVDDSVNLLLQNGVAKEKLIVGIPAFGSVFTLQDPNMNDVGAPTQKHEGPSDLKFNEICLRAQSGNLNCRWDDDQKVPYAFTDTEWIGYDDVRSVTEKANYIKSMDLGGAMIWDIASDDFSGACGLGAYPLISAVYEILSGDGSVSLFSRFCDNFRKYFLILF